MVLGLSHSLSRYKLKFSPDKVDTMIIQAIGTLAAAFVGGDRPLGFMPYASLSAAWLATALLDDLDKELNKYAMRVKEWYGWHFPEMGKVIVDNIAYAKTVKAIGAAARATGNSIAQGLHRANGNGAASSSDVRMHRHAQQCGQRGPVRDPAGGVGDGGERARRDLDGH